MNDVRIVFTASTQWVSRVIRWVMRSKVSHVSIEYPSKLWGGRWIAEATKGGVRKVQSSKAKKHVFAEFRCKFEAESGLRSVAKYCGEEYDYTGALAFGFFVLFRRWFKVKARHPLRSSKAQFCSEFVARFFQGVDIGATKEWDVERSDPGRLYRFCDKRKDLFERLGVPHAV